MDDIEEVIDNSSAAKGKLNINCRGYIGADIIAPMVNDFISQYPSIKVKLDFSYRRVGLISGEFDIVFSMGFLEDSNLIASKINRHFNGHSSKS